MKASATSSVLSYIAAVLLMMPVLYVGTWPLVERRFTVTTKNYFVTGAGAIAMSSTLTKPPWINTLYAPLHTIRDWNGGDNLLARYWTWCGGP